jgi:hypothetical protein
MKLASITFLSLVLSPTGSINLGFTTEGRLAAMRIIPSLGVPNWSVIYINTAPSTSFLVPLSGRKKTSARGVSHAQSFTLFLFCFTLFLLASFYQKYKKIVSFIVAFIYLLLILLEWVLLKTPSCVTLLAPKTMILSALLLRQQLSKKIL